MSHPKALKKGDIVGVAAPASPFDRQKFLRGIKALEAMGLRTHFRKDIFDQNRYFAGTEARRADEFTELIERKDVAAIMFARGGYGSQRVIPMLDAERIAQHRKPVVGFSDLTALLNFLRQSAGVPTMYGPVVTQLADHSGGRSAESLMRALTTEGPLGDMPVDEARTLKAGRAEGKFVGGCISLVNSSLKTPYELDADDSILFLEDTGEKVYVIDRMLTQLKASGTLRSVRGIVFGSLKPLEGEPHDVEEMISDVLKDFEGPIVTSFPAGHDDPFVTLPLGAKASLEASDGGVSLRFEEGLFS